LGSFIEKKKMKRIDVKERVRIGGAIKTIGDKSVGGKAWGTSR
jgi:hypothetical protein